MTILSFWYSVHHMQTLFVTIIIPPQLPLTRDSYLCPKSFRYPPFLHFYINFNNKTCLHEKSRLWIQNGQGGCFCHFVVSLTSLDWSSFTPWHDFSGFADTGTSSVCKRPMPSAHTNAVRSRQCRPMLSNTVNAVQCHPMLSNAVQCRPMPSAHLEIKRWDEVVLLLDGKPVHFTSFDLKILKYYKYCKY